MRKTIALAAALGAAVMAPAFAHADDDCHIGSYRLADGSAIDIAPSDKDTLRWRRFDGTTGALHKNADGTWSGTTGWTDHPDTNTVSFSDCATGGIHFDGTAGRRIAFDVTDTKFAGSGGVTLAGRLVLPKGNGKVPVVILTHGAEHDSALEFYSLQRMLPAEGIGVFVFDKRSTGSSGGTYTQDFDLLAGDDIAALHEARRLAGPRLGRIGYQGGSQAGWIIPIAVNREPVDFAIVGFGLAVTVLEEDQQEVVLEMKLKGHSDAEIAKALEVARAAEEVIASRFTSGFAAFDAVRAKYKDEPWYKDLHGNFTWALLPYTEAQLRARGKDYDWGTPFHYEPMPTLRANTTPQLWILGGDDLEAPSAKTGKRIKSLIAEGKPFTLALNPGAEHGMTEYELDATGERVSTRYVPGYFAMMRDFIRDGALHGTYGRSEITGPR